nr:glycosyltransferase 87 family protein [Rothia sp. ZJ1223]
MTIFDNEGFTKDLYVPDIVRWSEDFWLPFTYPPFAAMLFVPLAFMPHWLGVVCVLVLSFAVAWLLATLIYDYVNARGYEIPCQHFIGRTGTIALMTAGILVLGPWRRGLMGLVQINPLIMLLVLVDLLRPASRIPRGVLIGIAGGIKLTPLAFGLILLMRRDFKGVITLGISFFTTVVLGFILMPAEAKEFWFSALSDPSRVGNINFPDNISILGWLMHLGIPEGALLKILQYTLTLALLLGVAYLLPKLHSRRMVLSEISLNAFLMMMMSPISWSHHNIWLPLLMMTLWVDARPFLAYSRTWVRWVFYALTVVAAVGLAISPMNIAIRIHGSDQGLNDASAPALIVSSVPIICLFAAVMLWILTALIHRRHIATK